jgi:threonine dehydrogenase-like Zn-dependent dehydrogenase
VSPGTELGGWRSFSQKQAGSRRSSGSGQSFGGKRSSGGKQSSGDRHKPGGEAAHDMADGKPRKFGYANSGVVLAAGDGVTRFQAGDRVACMGAGYALHATHAVVPQNLCALLPAGVSFAQAAYMHLAATALQAVRRGEPQLGEYAAVVGLGIVGQLTARLYQLAGAYVIGWDQIPLRFETARSWGIDAVASAVGADESDEEKARVAETRRFAGGNGLDAAVIAFGGDADGAIRQIIACMKMTPDGHSMGRIVIVGGAHFSYTTATNNIDIRRSARTGPGYHDESWETGADYPPVFVRWSTRAHLELALRLIGEGKLDVDALTTHRLPFSDIDKEIPRLLKKADALLGVVFEMGDFD